MLINRRRWAAERTDSREDRWTPCISVSAGKTRQHSLLHPQKQRSGISRISPAAALVGERLWSDTNYTSDQCCRTELFYLLCSRTLNTPAAGAQPECITAHFTLCYISSEPVSLLLSVPVFVSEWTESTATCCHRSSCWSVGCSAGLHYDYWPDVPAQNKTNLPCCGFRWR